MRKLPTIEETIEFVKDAHTNHLLNSSKSIIPYHWHLIRVMLRLGENTNEETKIAALLHDVLEDTTITKQNLRDRGYSEKIISDVVYCSYTEFPKLSKQHWMRLIHQEAPTSVIRIKYADISDNLAFERMFGLYKILQCDLIEKNNIETTKHKKFHKATKDFPILSRIYTEIQGKNPYSLEPKVFPVYYDSLNYLLNSEFSNREHEIKNIESLEFSDRLLIKKLLNYLPLQEQEQYMNMQNLNTWTIKGTLSILYDNAQNPYIALNVDNNYAIDFQNYISINFGENYVKNQISRDKNLFHITVINAAEYGFIEKNFPDKIEIIKQNLNSSFNCFFHGIGKVEALVKKSENKNTAFFAIIENSALDHFREKINLKKHHFHLTIGFDKKDVHGVNKDKSTCIVSPEDVHLFNCQREDCLKNKMIKHRIK